MNVLESFRRKHNFTDTEVALADYILAHIDDITGMTIGSLSQVTHCSSSSIIRLCQKLGLNGYRDLRIELARELERSRSRMLEVNPDYPFIEGSSTANIANSIAVLSKQAIDATHASLSLPAVRKAARLLLGARRAAYYAVGDAYTSVQMLENLLCKIGITCIDGFARQDFFAVSNLLDSRDVALIVTYSGSLLDAYGKLIDAVRAKNCRTIVVTANPALEERLFGTDCLIQLPQDESRGERLATFYSQASIRFALNCIYAEAFSVNYQDNRETWQAIRKVSGEQ